MKRSILPLLFAPLLLITACSKDDAPVGPPGSGGVATMQLTTPKQTIFAGDTLQLVADVRGGASSGANWTLSPGIGTISDDGAYVAPIEIPGDSVTVTITATAKDDASVAKSAAITIRRMEILFRRPAIGSTFDMNYFKLDASGLKVPGFDTIQQWRVEADNVVFGTKDSLVLLNGPAGPVYQRFEPNGDVWIPALLRGDQTQWAKLPVKSRVTTSAVFQNEPRPDGSTFTRSYQANWLGDGSAIIDGRKYRTHTAVCVITETRTGDLGFTATERQVFTYAPALGMFIRIESKESIDGMSSRTDVWQLVSASLK